ncbi:hypothetical protein JG688_00010674 [Phytophthora aleatoria]|uniref:Uncharacterized protein n=1 Tax=Phytophthora aleatoria TaxID=2496075 RepID=A0A8J5J5D6_9STRA|nr:hypothetical protein JG688_00010674 [Phytophthora aleatoria]
MLLTSSAPTRLIVRKQSGRLCSGRVMTTPDDLRSSMASAFKNSESSQTKLLPTKLSGSMNRQHNEAFDIGWIAIRLRLRRHVHSIGAEQAVLPQHHHS